LHRTAGRPLCTPRLLALLLLALLLLSLLLRLLRPLLQLLLLLRLLVGKGALPLGWRSGDR
jgi:hypothetical protein